MFMLLQYLVMMMMTKLFAWGEGDSGGHVPRLGDDEPRPVWTSLPITH